jgi:septum formation protein
VRAGGAAAGRSVELILASTSLYRRRLLERLGIPFRVLAPNYVEAPDAGAGPMELALRHAAGKAAAVAAQHPAAVVIGSDQVAALGSEILSKPGSRERAIEQLSALAGRRHQLLTALVVRCGERQESHLERHELELEALTPAQIRAYVERDQPLDCAGSYKIEGLGVALMRAISGCDATAIEGLPLIALSRILRGFGLDPLLRGEQAGA